MIIIISLNSNLEDASGNPKSANGKKKVLIKNNFFIRNTK